MVRLNGQHVPDNPALLWRELARITRRVQHGRPQARGHIAQFANGSANSLLTLRGHLPEVLGGGPDLLFHLGREPLHGLDALQSALTLVGRHAIKLLEPVCELLLLLGREPVEAGLAFEGAALLLRREPLVVLEPLGQVLLAGRRLCAIRCGGRRLWGGVMRRRRGVVRRGRRMLRRRGRLPGRRS